MHKNHMEVGDRIIYSSEQTVYIEKWHRKGWASVLYMKVRVREIGFNPGIFSITLQHFEDERTDMNFTWEFTYLTALRIDLFFFLKAICLIRFIDSMTAWSWSWVNKCVHDLASSVLAGFMLSFCYFKTLYFVTSVSVLHHVSDHILSHWCQYTTESFLKKKQKTALVYAREKVRIRSMLELSERQTHLCISYRNQNQLKSQGPEISWLAL